MKYVFTFDDMLIAFKKGQLSKDDELFLVELKALRKCRNKQAQSIWKKEGIKMKIPLKIKLEKALMQFEVV